MSRLSINIDVSQAVKNLATLEASIQKVKAGLNTSIKGDISPGIKKSLNSTNKFLQALNRVQQTLKNVGRSSSSFDGIARGINRAISAVRTLSGRIQKLFQRLKKPARIIIRVAASSIRRALGAVRRLKNAIFNLKTLAGGIVLGFSVRGITRFIDKTRKALTIMQTLKVTMAAMGELKGISDLPAKSLAFLREVAEKTATSLPSLIASWKSFGSAGLAAGYSYEKLKKIFLDISIIGRTLNLSPERLKLAFLALEQMISKGVISMQDMRRQLGEHIPGAFELFAQSANKTTQEMNKLIASGKLLTKGTLVPFAEKLRATFGSSLPEALKKTDARITLLSNSLWNLYALFGKEFFHSFNSAFDALTKRLSSDPFKEFVTTFARNFGIILTALTETLIELGDKFAPWLGDKINQGMSALANFIVILRNSKDPLETFLNKIGSSRDSLRSFAESLSAISTALSVIGTAFSAVGSVLSFFYGGLKLILEVLKGIAVALAKTAEQVVNFLNPLSSFGIGKVTWGEDLKKMFSGVGEEAKTASKKLDKLHLILESNKTEGFKLSGALRDLVTNGTKLSDEFNKLINTLGMSKEEIIALGAAYDKLNKEYPTTARHMREQVGIGELNAATWEKIISRMNVYVNSGYTTKNLLDGLSKSLGDVTDKNTAPMTQLIAELTKLSTLSPEQLTQKLQEFDQNLQAMDATKPIAMANAFVVLDTASTKVATGVDIVAQKINQLPNATAPINALSLAINNLATNITSLQQFSTLFQQLLVSIQEALPNITMLTNSFVSFSSSLQTINSQFLSLKESFINFISGAQDSNEALNQFSENIPNLTEILPDTTQALYDFSEGFFSLRDVFIEVSDNITNISDLFVDFIPQETIDAVFSATDGLTAMNDALIQTQDVSSRAADGLSIMESAAYSAADSYYELAAAIREANAAASEGSSVSSGGGGADTTSFAKGTPNTGKKIISAVLHPNEAVVPLSGGRRIPVKIIQKSNDTNVTKLYNIQEKILKLLQDKKQKNIPGFAKGTPNTAGGGGAIPAILHPNEAVIPLSGGRNVPVQLSGKNGIDAALLNKLLDSQRRMMTLFVRQSHKSDKRLMNLQDLLKNLLANLNKIQKQPVTPSPVDVGVTPISKEKRQLHWPGGSVSGGGGGGKKGKSGGGSGGGGGERGPRGRRGPAGKPPKKKKPEKKKGFKQILNPNWKPPKGKKKVHIKVKAKGGEVFVIALKLLAKVFNYLTGGGGGGGPPKPPAAPKSFAKGTPNTAGGGGAIPAILHPNEAVIPLSGGRNVPVQLSGKNGIDAALLNKLLDSQRRMMTLFVRQSHKSDKRLMNLQDLLKNLLANLNKIQKQPVTPSPVDIGTKPIPKQEKRQRHSRGGVGGGGGGSGKKGKGGGGSGGGSGDGGGDKNRKGTPSHSHKFKLPPGWHLSKDKGKGKGKGSGGGKAKNKKKVHIKVKAKGGEVFVIGLKLISKILNYLTGGGGGGGPPKSPAAPTPQKSFAKGTPNTSGKIPATLHKNEAVIPLSAGGFVPVQIKEKGAKKLLPQKNKTSNIEGSKNTNSGPINITMNISTPDAKSFNKSKTQIISDLNAEISKSFKLIGKKPFEGDGILDTQK